MSKEAKLVKAGKAFKDAKPKGLIQHKNRLPYGSLLMPSFLFCLLSVVGTARRAFERVTRYMAVAIYPPVTIEHGSSCIFHAVRVEFVDGALISEVDGLNVYHTCSIHAKVLTLPSNVLNGFTKDAFSIEIDKRLVFVFKAYACIFTIEKDVVAYIVCECEKTCLGIELDRVGKRLSIVFVGADGDVFVMR